MLVVIHAWPVLVEMTAKHFAISSTSLLNMRERIKKKREGNWKRGFFAFFKCIWTFGSLPFGITVSVYHSSDNFDWDWIIGWETKRLKHKFNSLWRLFVIFPFITNHRCLWFSSLILWGCHPLDPLMLSCCMLLFFLKPFTPLPKVN